ncbi:MAG: VOC family protein [Dehalococcoidales bacterium]|nr:VOC family protein [Dehalococcoidales bacterium]
MERIIPEKSTYARLHHVGVVVKDIDKAIAYFESMGIGPFSAGPDMKKVTIPFKGELHGKPAEWKTTISNANLGSAELELLEPTEGDQALRESLDAAGEGLHHIGFLTDNLEEAIDRQTKLGAKVWTRSIMPGQINFAYFEGTPLGNIAIEIRDI